MNRLILVLGLAPALFTTAAFAQTAPADATKDLWCGTAMVAAFTTAPPGATPEQLALAKTYVDAGNMLIGRATTAHQGAGFTDAQIAALKTELSTKIPDEIAGTTQADFTFDECSALLPAPAAATAPAPAASSSEAPAADAAPAETSSAPAPDAASSAAQ